MRVLVVDENKDTLNEMYVALSRKGFDVATQENPGEAIKLYKWQNFDVVISEIEMISMNGISLLKELQKINKDVPVIFITRHGYFETAKEALNNRAYAYLEKPFDLDELLNYLKEIEIKITDNSLV